MRLAAFLPVVAALGIATGASAAGKKKHNDDDEPFGADGVETADLSDNGAGIHRDQMGVDKPYFNEVSGSTTLNFLSTKVGSGSAQPETDVDIGGAFLFIFGHVELGPEIGLHYSQTSETLTTGAETTTIKSTGVSYSVGPLVKVNFANLDHKTVIPFAQLGIAYYGDESKDDTPAKDDVKSTGFRLHVGGGLDLFVTSNVAFQPVIEYVMDSTKPSDGSDKSTDSGVRLSFGIGTFL